jgi:hypothetical protein
MSDRCYEMSYEQKVKVPVPIEYDKEDCRRHTSESE